MRYLIIGLGIYGTSLARDLAAQGHEVIGVDSRQNRIADVKDYISTTYLLDSTDESALSVLPLDGVDLTVVAIGENFGASIKTVALLMKHGVKHIYARAVNDLHVAILESFKVERILTPEQASARFLTREMLLGTEMSALQITDSVFVTNFAVPAYFYGRRYPELKLSEYGIQLVAATRPQATTNVLGLGSQKYVPIDLNDATANTVQEGDKITVLATDKTLRTFMRHIS